MNESHEPAREIKSGAHALLLLPNMEALLGSLRADIEHARSRVWVETYIYRDDRFGRAFGERLARAAARGADVRLLYDALGSNRSSSSFFAQLRASGVDARPYRPLDVVLRASLWPRTHARIVILDGSGYVGGAAWGDEWLPAAEGGRGWHEVCARVRGPCVSGFARAFMLHWNEAGTPEPAGTAFSSAAPFGELELVVDSPARRNLVYERHRDRIRTARARVWLENAYFSPPRELARDLAAAAARGAEVKVIVPGPTDLPSVHAAARAQYSAWTSQGIQVFEYQPSVLHAKFAVIDDDWATIGTFNANATSLRWVNEANLFVRDRRFVGQLASVFARDLAACAPVTRDSWQRRPRLVALRDAAWQRLLSWLEP